jgi:undecaprenyl phosphate-alpha-L-ara4N flippase subunit ArnE
MSANSTWSSGVWMALVGTPMLISGGQVLFKIVSSRISPATTLVGMVLDPYFVAAMIVYMLATFLWLYVLKIVPLGAAYTFTSLGFLIIPLISAYFFGEMLTWKYFIGTFLVMSGLVLIDI